MRRPSSASRLMTASHPRAHKKSALDKALEKLVRRRGVTGLDRVDVCVGACVHVFVCLLWPGYARRDWAFGWLVSRALLGWPSAEFLM